MEVKDYFFQHLSPKFGESETKAMWKYYSIHCLQNPPFKQDYKKHVVRLLEDYPIQYLVGEAAFYDLVYMVNESVLIPRPETEELVEWIIEDHIGRNDLSIIDVGTGSGCIILTLGKHLDVSSLIGIDISNEAIAVAKFNAAKVGVHAKFRNIDILNTDVSYLPKVDILVSNPPYIAIQEKDHMSTSTLKHEPDVALYAEDVDPNIFYKWIASNGERLLNENGSIYVELNALAYEAIAEIFAQAGWTITVKTDIFGNYRMLKATK
jgi:release factor glutamine methyltransferase